MTTILRMFIILHRKFEWEMTKECSYMRAHVYMNACVPLQGCTHIYLYTYIYIQQFTIDYD